MKGGLYLSFHPESRNNKVINEHINYFLDDLRSLTAFKDKHEKTVGTNLKVLTKMVTLYSGNQNNLMMRQKFVLNLK